MLEQQQSQLVSGLQEMYRRLQGVGAWSGDALVEHNSHPLTHDILAALDLLETKHDGSGELESFEDDCGKLQSKLLADGAGLANRRGSVSSESEHSHSYASHGTPPSSKPVLFRENFNLSEPTSPVLKTQSPAPFIQQRQQSFPTNQPSPLQRTSPLTNDPQFYQAGWAYPEVGNADLLFRSNYTMQPPQVDQTVNNINESTSWETPSMPYDAQYVQAIRGFAHYPHHHTVASMPKMHDEVIPTGEMDLMMVDAEFNQFIQVMT